MTRLAASPRLQLLLLGLGTLGVPLDTATNIAFPAITAAFALPIEDIQWVVICYVLTHAGLMLGFGRIGDLFGHAMVFRIGLAWSAVAYLLCAAAPSFGVLVFCRFLQGVGAALVLSCGPALATGLFPEARRARVLGAYAAMFAIGAALGPSVGGLLVQEYGWPAVYWARTPTTLLALLLLRLPPAPQASGSRPPFDMVGAGLLALALTALLLALNRARLIPDGDPTAVSLLLVSMLAGLGFVRWERRFVAPMLDLRVFAQRSFALLSVANILLSLAGFAVLLLVPYYLARFGAMPWYQAGFVLALSPGGTMLSSPLAGRLLGRLPPYPVALGGAVILALGLGLIATWQAEAGLLGMAVALLLQGIGIGLFHVAYLELVTATLPRQDRGVAGSLANVTRTMGVVGGASLLMLLFRSVQASGPAGLDADAGFLAAFSATFAAAAALSGAVAMLAVLLRPRR